MTLKLIIRGLYLSTVALMLSCKAQTQVKAPINIAVATNFYETALALEMVFEQETGIDISVTSGSTGQLYAQIRNGAPHDIFLAADAMRPQKLIEANLAQDQFTYAIGRLVLWSHNEEAPNLESLTQVNYRHLAIANPALAPYGFAAQEVIAELELSDKIVMGENIGQTFGLVETANAEFGFVSLAQIISRGSDLKGRYWIIPQPLYTPIIQDAVLLKRGAKKTGAISFYVFLKSETARDIIKAAGYKRPNGT